jgi:integrase
MGGKVYAASHLPYSEFIFFYPLNPAKHLLKVPKSWASLLKEAGVKYTRLYDCRATFSSRMHAVGVSPIFTDHMMGHAGGLAHVYAKATTEFKRDAIQKLDAFITAEVKKLELAALVIPQPNSRPN